MKRAYRKIPAVFAVVMLLLTAAVRLFLPTVAADSVILTVSGYKINQPQKETMPFFQSGTLFVPTEMFSTLGLTVTEQTSAVLVSNMKSGRILYFDTATGMATDAEGVYQMAALHKNGAWFVPAEFTADRLDLIYWYQDVSPAPFVRITYRDDNLMSNESFLRYYRSAVPELLQQFVPQATTVAITTHPPVSTAQSSAPPTSPSTTPAVTTPPPAEYRVYLAVNGLQNVDAVLSALEESGAAAVFRLSPGEITAADAGWALRKIAAAGHGFALVGNDNTTVEALTAANAALFAQTRCVTRLLLWTEPPRHADAATLTAAGYLSVTVDAAVDTAPSSVASACSLLQANGRALLLVSAAEMPAVQKQLHTSIAKELPSYPLFPEFGLTE